jgi:hypothetical protein
MKKTVFVILLFTALILPAHEVSFIYSVLEDDKSNQTVEKGWILNFAALRWGNNDFSDYALSLNLTKYGPSLRTDLDQAWLRFPIIEDLKLRVGKQTLDFSSSGKSGSC